MNTEKSVISIKIAITQTEKQIAKRLAKSLGYSFQGWLGNLVKNEIKNNEVLNNKKSELKKPDNTP